MVRSHHHASPFAFLALPRELRDLVYDHVLSLPDTRSERSLRIERRNLRHFTPSAATILLLLHHHYFLLNRQVAHEALDHLFKRHTVLFNCGPFVLKSLLERIAQHGPLGRQWLACLKRIQLDWLTFPDLRQYVPAREDGSDPSSPHHAQHETDRRHHHHHHHHGDNDVDAYEQSVLSLYYSGTTSIDFLVNWDRHRQAETLEASKLELLVASEVSPLFALLASPLLHHLTTLTIPLYFVSKQQPQYYQPNYRPQTTFPIRLRYWIYVCAYALRMLASSSCSSSSSSPSSSSAFTPSQSSLQRVCVHYLPCDIWASMDPPDDLAHLAGKGIHFHHPNHRQEDDDNDDDSRAHGQVFCAVWKLLRGMQGPGQPLSSRLRADVRLVAWDGNVNVRQVGDRLQVDFTTAKEW